MPLSFVSYNTCTLLFFFMQYSTLRQVTPPVEGFYVYVRHIDKDDDRDYIRYPVNGADERSHRIDTLEPEETYDIKMKSFNDEGESNRSKVLRCTTLSKLQAIYCFRCKCPCTFFFLDPKQRKQCHMKRLRYLD